MNKGIIKPTERHIYKLGFNILKKNGTKKSKLIEGALAFYNTIISARNISIGKIYKEISISGNTEYNRRTLYAIPKVRRFYDRRI